MAKANIHHSAILLKNDREVKAAKKVRESALSPYFSIEEKTRKIRGYKWHDENEIIARIEAKVEEMGEKKTHHVPKSVKGRKQANSRFSRYDQVRKTDIVHLSLTR